MTDQRRQTILDCAHRLRSRFTYILLCSHGLQSGLCGKLSNNQLAEFQQLGNVLEETKAELQSLLKQLEPELRRQRIKDIQVQMIGMASTSENAASRGYLRR